MQLEGPLRPLRTSFAEYLGEVRKSPLQFPISKSMLQRRMCANTTAIHMQYTRIFRIFLIQMKPPSLV
jgi:hypothetical protein